MSKRSITYVKPQEPEFLKKIKKQVGYEEGPTVDTKREQLGPAEDLDCDDEQPTVVVLSEGDLTAEEARREKERLEREAEEAPADLNARVVFRRPAKKSSEETTTRKGDEKKAKRSLLSFDEEEEEEDDDL